jgi:chromosome segregation ATPase
MNSERTDLKIADLKQELVDDLASKIALLNMRLKWVDISASKLKRTVETQAKEIEAVSVALKDELAQEISLVNQKLMVMDSQIERLNSEKAAQVDVAQLRKEFDGVVGRVNTLALSLAFEQGMTQKILSEIGNIKEAADLLDTKVAILYAEYATKEMLEAEIAQVNASLQELEELTYTLNEKTEKLVADKVWALNQRLKWVDITIKRAKDERAELKDYVLALETRLEEEINSKVAYINMRLKWTDISITKLKETKVEKKEYNETVTRLDTVKVDKETFATEMDRIDMKFVSLENNIEDFKKETNTLLAAHKEMLEARIDSNTDLIKENKTLIENNESEIQKLESRIAELEKEVFPEEKNTSAFGVLVGFGLVVGLGMVLASAN